MELSEAIQIINNNKITAYEIYKKTGLNESGIRRVLNKEVSKPQRRTRNSLIKIASYFELNGNLNDFDLNSNETIDTQPKSILSELNPEEILNHLLTNKSTFIKEPKIKDVLKLYSDI
ncbi:hypothetical protein [Tenacibaculum sp. 190524A05c]|uniref:hypothetical protein n=1 Tax=Tenacibaculum platacis TaxID=3137852 RepID=UPI0031FB9A2F